MMTAGKGAGTATEGERNTGIPGWTANCAPNSGQNSAQNGGQNSAQNSGQDDPEGGLALDHLGIAVRSAAGVRPASDRVRLGGRRYFFVHPESTGGVLVELVGR